jgi:hypothetical protein
LRREILSLGCTRTLVLCGVVHLVVRRLISGCGCGVACGIRM